MANLIAIVLALVLASAFLVLTRYESKRGVRVLATHREALDREVERALFVINHVDFAAFLRENAWSLFVHTAHLLAHGCLQSVRYAERLLTRAVRYFRHQVASAADPAPTSEARPFVKALSSFKRELEATRPPFPDIEQTVS